MFPGGPTGFTSTLTGKSWLVIGRGVGSGVVKTSITGSSVTRSSPCHESQFSVISKMGVPVRFAPLLCALRGQLRRPGEVENEPLFKKKYKAT